jgi:hypothetical protein
MLSPARSFLSRSWSMFPPYSLKWYGTAEGGLTPYSLVLNTSRSKLRRISMQGTFIFIFALLTLHQAAGNTLAVHLVEKWPDAFSSGCLTHTSNLRAHKLYIRIKTLKLYRRACHSQLSRGDQHQIKGRQSFSLFRIMLRNQRFVAL